MTWTKLISDHGTGLTKFKSDYFATHPAKEHRDNYEGIGQDPIDRACFVNYYLQIQL